MRIDRILPLALVLLMFGAAVVSACCRRWLDVVYWLGAVALNVSILLR